MAQRILPAVGGQLAVQEFRLSYGIQWIITVIAKARYLTS
jgi:hypothetical protein